MGKIFQRQWLTASQLRTVADRRYDDAEYLRRSKNNARANGVFYLGGFVIECLLKAQLVQDYPAVTSMRDPARLDRADREIWDLVYRSHDLDAMLARLPGLARRMIDSRYESRKLRDVCSKWTIFARYSSHTETMDNASSFLDDIRELKKWLQQ